MFVSIKAEARRVRVPTSVAVSCMRKERRRDHARSAHLRALVPRLNREVEDGVGVRLRLKREMPPFLRVVLEAVRLHGLDQQRAVLTFLVGELWNDRVRLEVEAVEARAHGNASVCRLNGLRRRAWLRLPVFGERRRL